MSFIVSLDLGQKQDYSAVVVLERPLWCPARWWSGVPLKNAQDKRLDFGVEDDWLFLSTLDRTTANKAAGYLRSGDKTDWPANVAHVDRWLKGTSYPDIIKDTLSIVRALQEGADNVPVALIIDATGVGGPVVDMINDEMRSAAMWVNFFACTITGGTSTTWETTNHGQAVTVPKRDLVMSAVRMLEQDRLRWPSNGAGDMVRVMTDELKNFQMKYSKAGNELFEAERKAHDDLVLALSMATWLSQSGRFPMGSLLMFVDW